METLSKAGDNTDFYAKLRECLYQEELIKAKSTPDDYKHLRVRVSGFSDYFVKLNEALQDDIIARTEQK